MLNVLENYNTPEDVNEQFDSVWRKITADYPCSSVPQPTAVLLGGQPGAGKSFATSVILRRLHDNALIINGDEYRPFHRYFHEINAAYGEDSVKYTGEFAGLMVQRIRDEGIKRRLNLIIEGTFRTPAVPMNELSNFREHGYRTGVVICTCPKELSWQSTLERAAALKAQGKPARYVPKAHHDLVVECLGRNVEYVLLNGKPDFLEVYNRSGRLFDSRNDNPRTIKNIINGELQITQSKQRGFER